MHLRPQFILCGRHEMLSRLNIHDTPPMARLRGGGISGSCEAAPLFVNVPQQQPHVNSNRRKKNTKPNDGF